MARTSHSDLDEVGFRATDCICKNQSGSPLEVSNTNFMTLTVSGLILVAFGTSWLQEIHEGLGHLIYRFGRLLDCVGTRAGSTFRIVLDRFSGAPVHKNAFLP